MAHRLCAEPQARTGLTVFRGEFDLDDLIGSVVDGWCPAEAFVSLWTGGLLCLPVDKEVAGIKARFVAGLPAVIASCRTNQLKLVVTLALHEQLGIHIAGIDNMLPW